MSHFEPELHFEAKMYITYGSNSLPSFSQRHSNPSKAPSQDFADILHINGKFSATMFSSQKIPNTLNTLSNKW
jgi:hypothetical protein